MHPLLRIAPVTRLSRLLLFLFALVPLSPAAAADLVYVHEAGCPYCREWEARIGPIYPRSAEARRAPLRPVEKRSAELGAIKLARPIRYTPTFVLVEDGVELARMEGYGGEDFFWGRLAKMLEALPN